MLSLKSHFSRQGLPCRQAPLDHRHIHAVGYPEITRRTEAGAGNQQEVVFLRSLDKCNVINERRLGEEVEGPVGLEMRGRQTADAAMFRLLLRIEPPLAHAPVNEFLALQGQADGKGQKHRHGWRDEPDQIYEGTVGKYVQHVYGEKEYGGTQVLKLSGVPFEKVGMPNLPPEAAAAHSESIQHMLYGGLVMPLAVLGAMTFVAKRNVHHDDDDQKGEN